VASECRTYEGAGLGWAGRRLAAGGGGMLHCTARWIHHCMVSLRQEARTYVTKVETDCLFALHGRVAYLVECACSLLACLRWG
jgi:hypothetical protein